MSAKRVFALLVVVVLGLLLTSPTALSRSEIPRYTDCPVFNDVTNPDDGDPDDDADGLLDGDDDNWDKAAGHGPVVAESFGAGDGAVRETGNTMSESKLSLAEVGFGIRLVLFAHSWILIAATR